MCTIYTNKNATTTDATYIRSSLLQELNSLNRPFGLLSIISISSLKSRTTMKDEKISHVTTCAFSCAFN